MADATETDATETDAPRVAAIIRQADGAFEAARGIAPRERQRWLDAIADALDGNADELVTLAGDESHLPEPRLRGELLRTSFQLRLLAADAARGEHLAATIDHADPKWGMGPRPDIRRLNEPIGVVGVFGASNFPFAFSVLGGDTASALAAGCAVVHKAHPAHPALARRTAALAVSALRDAGAPDHLFALIEGQAAGEALVDHPLVRAVGFTGSTRAGRALFDRAAARAEPIPFYGELGSTNPVFVTEGAWASRRSSILEGFIGSVGLGMGQFCTKPGYLVVPASDPDALAASLTTAASALGRHPMLTDRLRQNYESALSEMSHLVGVEPLSAVAADGELPPVVVLRTTAAAVIETPGILNDEMFGPASVLVEYESDDELLAVAALTEGQLTTGIQAEAHEEVARLRALLSSRSGRVLWNGWPTGVTVSYAQQHGGPYPATTAPGTTSVGTAAIDRFVRPVAYQDFPDAQLPLALQDGNPWRIPRRIDGEWERS